MSVHMGKRCMHMQQAILQGDVELLQKLLAGQWRNPRGDGIFILSLKALLTVINAPEVESVNHFDFIHWWGGGCYAHVMHRQLSRIRTQKLELHQQEQEGVFLAKQSPHVCSLQGFPTVEPLVLHKRFKAAGAIRFGESHT